MTINVDIERIILDGVTLSKTEQNALKVALIQDIKMQLCSVANDPRQLFEFRGINRPTIVQHTHSVRNLSHTITRAVIGATQERATAFRPTSATL